MSPDHSLFRQLLAAGAIGNHLEEFHATVRDRDDVRALRCPDTGVIVLDRIDHIDDDFYRGGDHNGLLGHESLEDLIASQTEDTERRAALVAALVTDSDWTDVGTGAGAILDRLGSAARSVSAVEPQDHMRKLLLDRGYLAASSLIERPSASADVMTEFHVFEHVVDPSEHLHELRRCLRPGGTLVLEVPHAGDALLGLYDSAAFRRFTLWSEHLVLHTAASLERLLRAGGFRDVEVSSVQRYPLANHLLWLAKGEPGGHHRWPQLRSDSLDREYEKVLVAQGVADTLIAIARSD